MSQMAGTRTFFKLSRMPRSPVPRPPEPRIPTRTGFSSAAAWPSLSAAAEMVLRKRRRSTEECMRVSSPYWPEFQFWTPGSCSVYTQPPGFDFAICIFPSGNRLPRYQAPLTRCRERPTSGSAAFLMDSMATAPAVAARSFDFRGFHRLRLALRHGHSRRSSHPDLSSRRPFLPCVSG